MTTARSRSFVSQPVGEIMQSIVYQYRLVAFYQVVYSHQGAETLLPTWGRVEYERRFEACELGCCTGLPPPRVFLYVD